MKLILPTLSAALFLTLFNALACADEPAKHNCVQPVIPQPLASDLVLKQFQKKMERYKSCISKFVTDQQTLSKDSADVTKSNSAHDAAEAAIKEYNEYMTLLNERNKRANSVGGDDDDDGK